MSKTTVTRLFIGSLIAAGAGAIVAVTAVWLALANGVFVMTDPISSVSKGVFSRGP